MITRNPHWFIKALKTMLKRKNRLYNKYKRHGYNEEDELRLDTFRKKCQKAVEFAKLTYLSNLGNKLDDPGTSQNL